MQDYAITKQGHNAQVHEDGDHPLASHRRSRVDSVMEEVVVWLSNEKEWKEKKGVRVGIERERGARGLKSRICHQNKAVKSKQAR